MTPLNRKEDNNNNNNNTQFYGTANKTNDIRIIHIRHGGEQENCCDGNKRQACGSAATSAVAIVLAALLMGTCLRMSPGLQPSCMRWVNSTADRNWIGWNVAPTASRNDHDNDYNASSLGTTTNTDTDTHNNHLIVDTNRNTNQDENNWTPNVIFGNYSMPITFDFTSSYCGTINSTGTEIDSDIDNDSDIDIDIDIEGSRYSIQNTFDEGLMECYGFAFFEARKTATKLLAVLQNSPSWNECQWHLYCPMCYWLLAMGYSPFVNHPRIADKHEYENAAKAAKAAFDQAHGSNDCRHQHSSNDCHHQHRHQHQQQHQPLSLKELGLIDAMDLRFRPSFENQTIGYESYSKKLKDLHETIALADSNSKGDSDVMGFLADSIMILHSDAEGYHFYEETDQQTPKPGIAYAISLLEDCLEESPDHPLCQHLYVHIVEPSGNIPVHKAATVADRLSKGSYATEAQHLQHMPSHTYLRIGRYHDAVSANVVAHESDEAYIHHALVPYGPAHDIAFLIYAAQLSGERETAYRYADVLRDHYRNYPTNPDGPGTEQGWHIWRTVRLRFGDYASIREDDDDIASGVVIETEKPMWPYAIVLGHYSKGVASLRINDSSSINAGTATNDDDDKKLSEAMNHLLSLRDAIPGVGSSFHGMATVANLTLSAAIEYYRRSRTVTEIDRGYGQVLELYRKARIEQESWVYTEPPSWYTTVALCEGTLLRMLGRYDESIETFRNDLKRVPKNRYALYGLKTTMVASGANASDIQEATDRFNTASLWSDPDVRNSIPVVCPELGE